MSIFRIGAAVLVAVTALASAEPASAGLRIRLGGPFGVIRSAFAHMLPVRGLHHRHYARRGGAVRLASVRDTVDTTSRTDGFRNAEWSANPSARVQLAASAALAGWHGGRGVHGWWRHEDGGYGWVGPLFWPFAYQDIYDYTVWGDTSGFWGYGYGDLYAAVFAPYGNDDLTRYVAPSRGRRHGRIISVASMCGDAKDDAATAAVDQIRQVIQLNEEQGAALDDLAGASVEAAKIVRAVCPGEVAATAALRLAAMQQRLEAMVSAVARVRPTLERFYELLDDEQKGKLEAFGEGQRKQRAASKPSPARSCQDAQPASFQWPGGEIEARLHLDDAQRAELLVLQHMSAKARDILSYDCQPDEGILPPDRLASVDTRLDAMLDAIKLVRPALDDFYATLSDEQKAQFEAIGPKRTS